jgi:hypothetical protein
MLDPAKRVANRIVRLADEHLAVGRATIQTENAAIA